MAKRGTPEHPKTRRLGRALGMPSWAALGLLETFWHWVGRYRPSGLLSKDDLLDCAETIGIADLQCLIDTGWLDSVGDSWYVHDWHDHADDATKKTLSKRNEVFGNGSDVRATRQTEPVANESRMNREQVTNDSRQPKPKPKPTNTPLPPKGSLIVWEGDRASYLGQDLPFTSETFVSEFTRWIKHRKEKRSALTETTVQEQFAEFRKWDEAASIEAIKKSIRMGWIGVFEPKVDATEQTGIDAAMARLRK